LREQYFELNLTALRIVPERTKAAPPWSIGRLPRNAGASSKFWARADCRASDDDPSGIATYSQVGAQFGTA